MNDKFKPLKCGKCGGIPYKTEIYGSKPKRIWKCSLCGEEWMREEWLWDDFDMLCFVWNELIETRKAVQTLVENHPCKGELVEIKNLLKSRFESGQSS